MLQNPQMITPRMKNRFSLALIYTFLVFGVIDSYGQLQVVDGATAPYDPINLIENVFLGDGVELTNITHNGVASSVGFFSNGLGPVGLERGIVMTTGSAQAASDQNSAAIESSGSSGTSINDPQLASISTTTLIDQNIYEISFIPISDTLRFSYVFASEEYPDFVCSEFNDVFGFFINGPNPAGGTYNWENIALIPDPADPSGLTFLNLPVSINTVNNGVAAPGNPICETGYSQYFSFVANGQTPVYNGIISPFTAQAIVTPCEEYTIKLAIGDGVDNMFNSAVFLEAKSFGTGTLLVETEALSLDGNIAEGCSTAEISFSLPANTDSDYPLDFNILDSGLGGITIAENGIDYEMINSSLQIDAGSNTATFTLNAFSDGLVEGDEWFVFDIQRDVCNRDTFYIKIVDDVLEIPILPDDFTICTGQSELIDIELPPSFTLPDPPAFQNNTDLAIDVSFQSFTSEIEVSGVFPDQLGPGVIKSICIDTLTHLIPFDLDIYLITPGGQILELSTDNGQRPPPDNNFAQIDTFLNTCFTLDAIQNINNANPIIGSTFNGNETYTGNFQPEGTWDDIFDGDSPANGTYTLLIVDDESGFDGQLSSWSICFNSVYDIGYSWSSQPDGSLSCTECEDPVISPTVDTWYYLNTTDTYGCTRVDSFFVEVVSSLPAIQDISCDNTMNGAINFTWSQIAIADFYEISLDGGLTWSNIGQNLIHTITGLGLGVDVDILVRYSSNGCLSEVAPYSCTSLNCIAPAIGILDQDNPSCFGQSNGSINFSASGTTPPYVFTVGAQQNMTGVFDNLSAGMYTLEVEDGNNCVVSLGFNINEPTAIESDVVLNSAITCFGGNDGSATVTPSQGTPPYTFLWGTGEMNDTALALSNGLTYVTITDFNGCQHIDSITLQQPVELTASAGQFAAVDCFQEASGIGVVEADNGVGTYEYHWSTTDITLIDTLYNLSSGNYSVTVYDENDCSAVSNFSIDEAIQLTSTLDVSDNSCFGVSDGTATAQAFGGTGMYSFVWSNGDMGDSASNLAPGKHYVTITDTNNCIHIDSIEFNGPDQISYIETVEDLTCFESGNGSIDFEASGGTGNLSYDWSSPDLVFNSTSNNIQDLESGEYCVTVTDEMMCTVEQCFLISQPDSIDVQIVVVPVSCAGEENGAIDITTSGGTPSFDVQWENEVSFNDEDLMSLEAGTYNATITDAMNCQKSISVEVPEGGNIEITSQISNVDCLGAQSGSINLTVITGVMPFTFNWTGPNGFSSALEDLENVGAGMYQLQLTDDTNCMATYFFEIEEPNQGLSVQVDNALICPEATDGMLNAEVSGANGMVNYVWSNNETSQEIANLGVGTYTVTVSDENNCSNTAQGMITASPEMALFVSTTDVTCFGAIDGSATVDSILFDGVSGNLVDFQIMWNTTPIQNSSSAISLAGDQSYIITAEDVNGCTASASINILQPAEIDIDLVQSQNPLCAGDDNGFIEVIATGGNGQLSYLWDGNAGSQNTPIASNLLAGNYFVSVEDDQGCTAVQDYTITDPVGISFNEAITDATCNGANDGALEINPLGGSNDFNVLWSTGSMEERLENLTAGIYTVTLTDVSGCEVIDSFEVGQPDSDISLEIMTEDVSCFGGFDGMIEVIASGGNGIYQYSIDGEEYSSSPVLIGLTAGTYTVYVQDFEGCTTILEGIEIEKPEEIIIEIGTLKYVDYGESIQMFPTIINGQGEVSFQWSSLNIDQFNCDNCAFPTVDSITTNITVDLMVVDENGCEDEIKINIIAVLKEFVDVPTGFTPNGDGNNDLLHVFGKEDLRITHFRIFDRWGEMVYEDNDFLTNDLSRGWDGQFKGLSAQPGVYVWTVEAENVDGTVNFYNGETTLIK